MFVRWFLVQTAVKRRYGEGEAIKRGLYGLEIACCGRLLVVKKSIVFFQNIVSFCLVLIGVSGVLGILGIFKIIWDFPRDVYGIFRGIWLFTPRFYQDKSSHAIFFEE